jgi:sporulation integral membrane protein YtvI
MRNGRVYLKIATNLVLVIVGVLFTIFVLPKVLRFFMPFVIGWIISMIANPLVRFLEKRVKILRKHSSAIIIIVALAVIVGGLYAIIALIVREAVSLVNDLSNIFQNIEVELKSVSDRLNGIYIKLPDNMQNFVDKLVIQVTEYGSSLMQDDNLPTVHQASDVARNLADILLKSIITILSAYFFIAERDNLSREFRKIFPQALYNSYNLIVDNFKIAVGGYFKAQFKIMLILILILFIGLELLKVNYSFLLAVLIAFLDFLPFFGTGAVIWPWALVDFLLGNYIRAIFLVAIYLICQIVKQILQPKMVGDSIGISPLATLVFMFIGYQIMGVLGMIIGIPIGMVIVNFYRLGMFDRIIKGFKILAQDINEFRKF